jgi:coatomer subunit beta
LLLDGGLYSPQLKEPELLDPLIPAIKECLVHRHSYVRKNAALAVFYIHKSFGERLLPDGPELINSFIGGEVDSAARRNAFMMLFNEAENLAIEYPPPPFIISSSFSSKI